MKRRIIEIDQDKCNGCGACAEACHEGAIAMVDGKAQLMRDDYCDGLGDVFELLAWNQGIGFFSSEIGPSALFQAYKLIKSGEKQGKSREDIWGNRNILSKTGPGQTFADVFACAPGAVLNVSVEAESTMTVMFLHIRRVLSVCPSACSHHSRFIRNLLGELAEKNLRLNEKLTHMGQRTTRAKLMSYFSAEALRRGVYEFDIPFSRQQLADYLGVERSGLSVELGKMRDEGLLDFHKSHFLLKTPEADRPFPSAR